MSKEYTQGKEPRENLSLYQWRTLSEEERTWYSNDLAFLSKKYIPEDVLECAGGEEASHLLVEVFNEAAARRERDLQKAARKDTPFGHSAGIRWFGYEEDNLIVDEALESLVTLPSVYVPVGVVMFARYGSLTMPQYHESVSTLLDEVNKLFVRINRLPLPPLPPKEPRSSQ